MNDQKKTTKQNELKISTKHHEQTKDIINKGFKISHTVF